VAHSQLVDPSGMTLVNAELRRVDGAPMRVSVVEEACLAELATFALRYEFWDVRGERQRRALGGAHDARVRAGPGGPRHHVARR
jgi:hypothetical protein